MTLGQLGGQKILSVAQSLFQLTEFSVLRRACALFVYLICGLLLTAGCHQPQNCPGSRVQDEFPDWANEIEVTLRKLQVETQPTSSGLKLRVTHVFDLHDNGRGRSVRITSPHVTAQRVKFFVDGERRSTMRVQRPLQLPVYRIPRQPKGTLDSILGVESRWCLSDTNSGIRIRTQAESKRRIRIVRHIETETIPFSPVPIYRRQIPITSVLLRPDNLIIQGAKFVLKVGQPWRVRHNQTFRTTSSGDLVTSIDSEGAVFVFAFWREGALAGAWLFRGAAVVFFFFVMFSQIYIWRSLFSETRSDTDDQSWSNWALELMGGVAKFVGRLILSLFLLAVGSMVTSSFILGTQTWPNNRQFEEWIIIWALLFVVAAIVSTLLLGASALWSAWRSGESGG